MIHTTDRSLDGIFNFDGSYSNTPLVSPDHRAPDIYQAIIEESSHLHSTKTLKEFDFKDMTHASSTDDHPSQREPLKIAEALEIKENALLAVKTTKNNSKVSSLGHPANKRLHARIINALEAYNKNLFHKMTVTTLCTGACVHRQFTNYLLTRVSAVDKLTLETFASLLGLQHDYFYYENDSI